MSPRHQYFLGRLHDTRTPAPSARKSGRAVGRFGPEGGGAPFPVGDRVPAVHTRRRGQGVPRARPVEQLAPPLHGAHVGGRRETVQRPGCRGACVFRGVLFVWSCQISIPFCICHAIRCIRVFWLILPTFILSICGTFESRSVAICGVTVRCGWHGIRHCTAARCRGDPLSLSRARHLPLLVIHTLFSRPPSSGFDDPWLSTRSCTFIPGRLSGTPIPTR